MTTLTQTERTSTRDLIMNVQRQVADGVQDLSKGFVPIVLVIAMLGSAYYVGQKVEGMKRGQEATELEIAKIGRQLDALSPLVAEVSTLKATVAARGDQYAQLERDQRLNERDLYKIKAHLKIE